jgi:hypothetical protein
MITMIDEIYDRGHQAGRAQLHDGIDTLLRKLRDAFVPALTALHHVEWDAPWDQPAKRQAKH